VFPGQVQGQAPTPVRSRATRLERNARRVQLTEAGEALLPEAQAVLDAALAARDAVEGVSRGLRATLRVGMLSDLSLIDLPGLARDFRDRHPGVELQLRLLEVK
jgi:DNA-binding transcriptional LysR family regulator